MVWQPGQVALFPTQNRPDPNGARTARRRAARGGRRSGAWWHRGARTGSAVQRRSRASTSLGGRYSRERRTAWGTGRGGTVPFSRVGMGAGARLRVIARTVSRARNCPVFGPTWDSSNLSPRSRGFLCRASGEGLWTPRECRLWCCGEGQDGAGCGRNAPTRARPRDPQVTGVRLGPEPRWSSASARPLS